ncbi:heavy metal-responsive transcriptional regulator [Nitriliruptoraceae bacterium ZYF776]|nr:heavy metal-responsive transcriptional regulator [Profundirhabdus halotolerans]
MRIGEAARQVGVNPKTIRYYESIGLIPETRRTSSGYRDYGPDEIGRLHFVRAAQRLGLSLDEVGEVLAFRENGEQPCGFVLDTVRRRTVEIDRRVRELLDLRRELAELIDRAERTPATEARYCHLVDDASQARTTQPAESRP